MATHKVHIRRLVTQLLAGTAGVSTIIIGQQGAPLFYDFSMGCNSAFDSDLFSDELLDTEINMTPNATICHRFVKAVLILEDIDSIPGLKSLFYALVKDVSIGYSAALNNQLTTMARNGGLPYRQALTEAPVVFYGVADLQAVHALEQSIDPLQIGLVDCGLYDLSGNRAVGQMPELYIPLRAKSGFSVWIIFECTDAEYRYRFGVRTGPTTELIEIKPSQFTPAGVIDVLTFLTGGQDEV